MFFDLFDIRTTRIVMGSNIIHYEKGFIHPDRTLNFHDIIWYMSGECELFVGEMAFDIKPDDVVVVPAGRHHFSQTRSTPNTTICYIHFFQTPHDRLTDWSSGKAETYYERYSIDRIEEIPKTVLLPTVIHTAGHENIHRLFKKITTCSCSALTDERFETFFTMNRLLMSLQYCRINGNKPADPLIAQIINDITKFKQYTLSLESVAQQVNVSPATLARRFRNTTGMSFHKYFMKLRMDAARSLLLTPYCSIKEVANTLGFYDEFHFSKTFKQFYGISPSVFRTSIESPPSDTLYAHLDV